MVTKKQRRAAAETRRVAGDRQRRRRHDGAGAAARGGGLGIEGRSKMGKAQIPRREAEAALFMELRRCVTSRTLAAPGAQDNRLVRLYDYGPSPNCHKVRVLLAQLGQEYERVPIDIFGGDTLKPEYFEKNPGLTTPVLEPESGVYLPESGAILLYLAEGTPFLPDDPLERAQVYRWMMWEQARLFAIVGALRFSLGTGRLDPESREARQQLRFSTAIVGGAEAHLAANDFFVAGRYTVADIACYGYLQVAHEASVDMEAFPNVVAWLERVREQPDHVADLEPFPENAQRGKSKSIYDLVAVDS